MQVTCPACRKVSNSKADLSGKSVKCACGQSFVVPKAAIATTQTAALPNTATALQAPVISLKCDCGKDHRVPVTAAGKAVKCTCGKVIQVPADKTGSANKTAPQPAAATNPFHALNDDDWASLTPKPPPAPDPYAPPKPPSASSQLLAKAREEMGETKRPTRSRAGSQPRRSRWILIGIGAGVVLVLGGCAVLIYLLTRSR